MQSGLLHSKARVDGKMHVQRSSSRAQVHWCRFFKTQQGLWPAPCGRGSDICVGLGTSEASLSDALGARQHCKTCLIVSVSDQASPEDSQQEGSRLRRGRQLLGRAIASNSVLSRHSSFPGAGASACALHHTHPWKRHETTNRELSSARPIAHSAPTSLYTDDRIAVTQARVRESFIPKDGLQCAEIT